MITSKNIRLLKSFTEYCEAHPELRFWQALLDWAINEYKNANFNSILVAIQTVDAKEPPYVELQDTFHWEDND